MVINLEFREDPPSRAQTLRVRDVCGMGKFERFESLTSLFQMTKGQVMSRNEFANTMREMKCPEESVQQWLRETRGDDTGLICLILEGTFRFLWFSVRNLTKYKNMDREFSKKAYATWAEDLAMQIEQGWRAGSENTAADLE